MSKRTKSLERDFRKRILIKLISINCLMEMRLMISLLLPMTKKCLPEIFLKDFNSKWKSKITRLINFRRIDSNENLEEEAIWIYKRFLEKNLEFASNSDVIKRKIQKILYLIRVEHLDIPMITMYRKFEYMKELTLEHVWQIFNFNLEYGNFMSQKQ